MGDRSSAAVIRRSEPLTKEQVCRHAKVTPGQLASWQRLRVLPPTAELTLSHIPIVRSLARMHALGLKGKRLLNVLNWLESRLREIDRPLEEVRFLRRGKRLVVRLPGQEVELWSGQMQFGFGPETRIVEAHSAEENQRRRRLEAEAWFQRGLELEQEQAPANEIIAAYLKAVELDNRSAGAFVNLGTIYFHTRMWRDAERYYLRAIEADPDYALAHFNLANLYDERADRQRALEHYEHALRLKPGYADAHYNLALLYQSQGQTMEALKHWKIYLRLDPSSSWAHIARREIQKLKDSSLIGGQGPAATATRGKDRSSTADHGIGAR